MEAIIPILQSNPLDGSHRVELPQDPSIASKQTRGERAFAASGRRKLMKMRIKGDSLRLRISPSEVSRLLQSGRIEESIHFGPEEDAKLTYALLTRSGPENTFAVRRSAREIEVEVPASMVRAWCDSEEVGMYGVIDYGTSRLEVAVEKDFACLDKSDAENTDTYPNPNQGVTC
jgi:hypothetical protein